MNKIKILFHSIDGTRHCADGFAAAWCAWLEFGDTADYIPVVYGREPPQINDGDRVFLLDFSYSRETLETWAERASLLVLDHHKTAEAELKGLPYAYFDMNRSGAQMAWDEFRPHQKRPALIDYVADRDLWRKELPGTEAIHLALALFPQNFEIYSALCNLEDYVGFMFAVGSPLLEQRNADVAEIAAGAQIVEMDGYKAGAIWTSQGALVSDALSLICQQHPEINFAFNVEPVDGGFRYNFRSVGNFDVSVIAKLHGGGGHKNASGCVVKSPIELIEMESEVENER